MDEGLPELALALPAEEGGGLVVLLVGDASEGDQASPRRSFRRLLAANTIRPWSKKSVLTTLPDWTWRSPELRDPASARSVSAMGVVARSVSILTLPGYHSHGPRASP